MNTSALASINSASLASTVERSAGVAVAHGRKADRADATAMSTSAGVARAISATVVPSAGLMTRCGAPPVTTAAPSIQLPAVFLGFADFSRNVAVMRQR